MSYKIGLCTHTNELNEIELMIYLTNAGRRGNKGEQ